MSATLQNQSLEAFLNTLASHSPTPGGGSVAALTGAMAAGLVSMVCNIVLKRNNSELNRDDIQSILDQAEALRHTLQELADADIEIFGRLSAAYKLPRLTEADAASRQAAIQKLTREATSIPLHTAQTASRLLPLCTTLVEQSPRMLVSDVGVAATLVRSTIQSALLNVEVNLAALEDQDFVRQVQRQTQSLISGLPEEIQGILEAVLTRIKS